MSVFDSGGRRHPRRRGVGAKMRPALLAMIAVYFVSDVILAIAFEPVLLLVRRALRRAQWFDGSARTTACSPNA